MSLNTIFEKHIDTKFPFLGKSKLLIAISGGIDSVVLTHLCIKTGLKISLAHCNFDLRGKESDADEEFVEELAENLNLEVFVQRFDTKQYAEDNKRSIQMAARELRYNWFLELAEQLNFDYILTAHHADDNLETFLINFTRGTGLEGLTGIPEINGKFIRPLLPFSSESIQQYARKEHIKWRDDSSNKSVKYLRNKLRHEVVPILKEINPSLLDSFESTLVNLKGSSTIIKSSIDAFLSKAIVQVVEDAVIFDISEFKALEDPKPYLYESLKEFGFTEWNDVLNLLDAETGKQVYSNSHRLIKNRDHLLLSPLKLDKDQKILIHEYEEIKQLPFGKMILEEVVTSEFNSADTIYLDWDKLIYPLQIRKRQEGDILYPIGMKGKKKLSKFFKDEKFSLLDKENTWLLCSNNEIVWVIKHRADNRFKVDERTVKILKIKLNLSGF